MLVLVGRWWTFVLRGVLAILFGLTTAFVPGLALLTLILLFGFYALADGVLNLIAAFRRDNTTQQPWWSLLISGLLGLAAGLIALFMPGLTAFALLYVISAWAVITGVMAIIAAVRLRKQIEREWLLALAGVLSVVFGVLIAVFPGAGALALALWIAAYAVVLGILLIVLGLKLRTRIRGIVDHPSPRVDHSVAPGH